MAKYLFTYHGGGMPDSEEEQARHMAAWGEWMGSHEGAFIDMGAPVGASMTVTQDGAGQGGGPNQANGYSLVEAESMSEACDIAKGCPVITLSGGSVEVGETFEIPEMG